MRHKAGCVAFCRYSLEYVLLNYGNTTSETNTGSNSLDLLRDLKQATGRYTVPNKILSHTGSRARTNRIIVTSKQPVDQRCTKIQVRKNSV